MTHDERDSNVRKMAMSEEESPMCTIIRVFYSSGFTAEYPVHSDCGDWYATRREDIPLLIVRPHGAQGNLRHEIPMSNLISYMVVYRRDRLPGRERHADDLAKVNEMPRRRTWIINIDNPSVDDVVSQIRSVDWRLDIDTGAGLGSQYRGIVLEADRRRITELIVAAFLSLQKIEKGDAE